MSEFHDMHTSSSDSRKTIRIMLSSPRRPSQVEQVPLQHGSPDIRRNYVYPTQPVPKKAFQAHPVNSPKNLLFQDMRNFTNGSPLSVRAAKVQDTTFSLSTETEETVGKIKALFPTVSDTHIKLLLKKYHGREVVVISALQVEKYPISTPGPFATPPPARNIHHSSINAPLQMTPPLSFRTGSRVGSPRPGSGGSSNYTGSPRTGDYYRNSPRPHSSPKLKLRYMKSVFPQAEETIILDVLSGNENNIQKTSEALKAMGFERKDTVKIAQKQAEIKAEEEKRKEEALNSPPPAPPRLKTTAEKEQMKKDLQEKYKDIQPHLIAMALESVNFDEDRANQILQIILQEEKQKAEVLEIQHIEVQEPETQVDAVPKSTVTISQSRQSLKSLLKPEKCETSSFVRKIEERNEVNQYRSPYLSNTLGSNPGFAKGTDDKLLLSEYMDWIGPDKTLRQGPKQGLAKGPDPSARIVRSYQPCGPNAGLRKGPKIGLAKGSIFSQFKEIVVGEARGK